MNYRDSLTLVRGIRATGQISAESLVKIVKSDSTHEEKVKKLEKLVTSAWKGHFSDMYFPVTFKVNKPIGLQALGFWGPFKEDYSTYTVKVTIEQLSSLQSGKSLRTLVSVDKEAIRAKKGSLFYVDLNKVVPCPAEAWIRIHFMLNGPATGVCASTKFMYTDDAKVTFEFGSSSKQLAEMKYILT